MQTVAYISHPDCALHDMGSHHPESPARLRAIEEQLFACGILQDVLSIQSRPVSPEALLRVHPQQHIDTIAALAPESGLKAVDPDTHMGPHSLNAAEMAAGAVELAVEGVMTGEFRRAFCAVRPPGHHAEREIPMGFCFFNNIAVGAAHAMATYGLERVAILDFDVHHGNGTVDIFKDDERVLVCSSFQHPFYPDRWWEIERRNIVNCPLSAGSDGDDFRRVVDNDWLPALERHRPELILVSAGFDAHRADPLGGLRFIEDDYRWVTERIVECAREFSDGRVISALEGGYDLRALAASVEAHLGALMA